MCRFFSALAFRDGSIRHDDGTDSHSDLIQFFNLEKAENSNCSHFAKIEFVPSDPKTMDDIETYTLTVDEESAPSWWDDVSETVLQKCRSVVSRMIITGDHKIILSGKFILGRNASVKQTKNANIVAMLGSSTVGEMRGSSTVGEMWGSSTVGKMWGSSTVGAMRESSTVGEMRESSTVGEMRGSSTVGKMREPSTVGEMWESSTVGEMWGSSTVGEMWESSTVTEDNRVKS